MKTDEALEIICSRRQYRHLMAALKEAQERQGKVQAHIGSWRNGLTDHERVTRCGRKPVNQTPPAGRGILQRGNAVAKETDTLIIQRVKCGYLKPDKPESSPEAGYPIQIEIDWMEVKCKRCGNEWKATSCIVPGPTCFHEVIGELLLLCSECGMQHILSADSICN